MSVKYKMATHQNAYEHEKKAFCLVYSTRILFTVIHSQFEHFLLVRGIGKCQPMAYRAAESAALLNCDLMLSKTCVDSHINL